jgi:Universal stress protein family
VIRKIGVGYDGSAEGRRDHPAEELACWGDTVDLLVVGSRGFGPVGRLVHGSTSRGLLQTAHWPLLVLTRSTRAMSTQGTEHDDRALAAT